MTGSSRARPGDRPCIPDVGRTNPGGVHPSLAMKVARASAGRPIRALTGIMIIHLVRGIKRPRNPF